jgi:acyl carrier protein
VLPNALQNIQESLANIKMKEYELKDSDPEDVEDLILKIEDSLDIYFEERELAYVKTFGQLCDHIKSKIKRVE